jgi:membrane fusion protein, multidrug efflux system
MLYRFFFFFCLSTLVLSCHSKDQKTPPSLPPVGVTAFTVEPTSLPIVFDYVGFAASSHAVEIRARVEGYLDKIAYDEGQLVHQGDLLFQLDPKQFEVKVEQARGEVARQEALLANAKLTVNRLKPLYEQKAASKKDLDNAIANQLAIEASLISAKAQLMDSEINLGYTTIVSPITGLTDKSRFREGALITPGPNSLLTTVSVFDPIWVYFTVSDSNILRIQKQNENRTIILPETQSTVVLPKDNLFIVEAILSDGTIFRYKGKLDFASPTYEQSTGTLLARAVFPNPDAEIRPGQFVKIKVYGAERPNAIFVPQRALMQKSTGMFVYLITEENKVVSQDVSTGDWYGDYQIITNGLKPGDQIVVDGTNKIRPGMTVQVTAPWHAPKEAPHDLSL